MPSDASALRATAHPTRLEILRLLGEHPALTATQCANLLGLSPKTCSYHLQTLAGAGWVEEMDAPGRLRPWRLSDPAPGTAIGPGATGVGAGHVGALGHAADQGRERARATRLRREETLLTDSSDALAAASATPAWSEAVHVHHRVAYMSPDELRSWIDDVERVTRRHVRRSAPMADGAPTETRYPVRLLFYGYPTDLD